MGAIAETWRGVRILVQTLAGAPVSALRIVLFAKTSDQARDIMRHRSQRLLDASQIDVVVSGTPPAAGRGCVLCYNESSFTDLLAYQTVMWPHIDRGSAADVYGWLPFVGRALTRARIELVPRKKRDAIEAMLARVVAAVRSGERLAWGGEGRLSGRDGVARFKVGASLIAIRAGVPIVPVVYYGGHRTFALWSLRARRGRILVRFGAPMSTEGLGESDARVMADRVHARIAAMYEDLRAVYDA